MRTVLLLIFGAVTWWARILHGTVGWEGKGTTEGASWSGGRGISLSREYNWSSVLALVWLFVRRGWYRVGGSYGHIEGSRV